MTDGHFRLNRPPIVEAVIDIDCDLPARLDFEELEQPARRRFEPEYPGFMRKLIPGRPLMTSADVASGTRAFQFLGEDAPQLVQIRRGGFSFNRLAPYSSLDDYMPEIERTWRTFLDLVSPVQIRRIALRYINRIGLPAAGDLREYVRKGPEAVEMLELSSFLNQYSAKEPGTDHEVNVTMTSAPLADGQMPLIFDIEAADVGLTDPHVWENIRTRIESLRRLKNHVFKSSLTEKCLDLFR